MNRISLYIHLLLAFVYSNINAQSIEYKDLVNLQKCDFEKAKGFFEYKGFLWISSEKNKATITYDGYQFYTDIVKWKKNSEEIQYITIPSGGTVLIYFASASGFSKLKEEVKKTAIKTRSETADNRLTTHYTLPSTLEATFNEKKGIYGATVYELIFLNTTQALKHKTLICDQCLGNGHISEYHLCEYCNGSGRKNCSNCSGKGAIYCSYCQQGYTSCNSCWGKGSQNCSSCWGNGKKSCQQCYGQGGIVCTECYGAGQVTKWYGVNVTSQCSKCKGNGRESCSSCNGNGQIACSDCSGKGNKTCPKCSNGKTSCSRCNGKYSQSCPSCIGSGISTSTCHSCSGKGTSEKLVKKTCPSCNGNKLK